LHDKALIAIHICFHSESLSLQKERGLPANLGLHIRTQRVLFPAPDFAVSSWAAKWKIVLITSKGKAGEEGNYIKNYSTEILGVKINEFCNRDQLLCFARVHKSAL